MFPEICTKSTVSGLYNSWRKEGCGLDEKRPGPTGAEVLDFLAGVMRGEENGSPHNMKAAELLGKRMGLFNETGESRPAPVIIDDIHPAQTQMGEEEGESG